MLCVISSNWASFWVVERVKRSIHEIMDFWVCHIRSQCYTKQQLMSMSRHYLLPTQAFPDLTFGTPSGYFNNFENWPMSCVNMEAKTLQQVNHNQVKCSKPLPVKRKCHHSDLEFWELAVGGTCWGVMGDVPISWRDGAWACDSSAGTEIGACIK